MDRRAALLVARSLQSALFFSEVEWGGGILQDGVEDVYMFLDDLDGGTDGVIERTELPTGVATFLTKCYAPSCEGPGCYCYSCPRKVPFMFHYFHSVNLFTFCVQGIQQLPNIVETPTDTRQEEWSARITSQALSLLTESEINRQTYVRTFSFSLHNKPSSIESSTSL